MKQRSQLDRLLESIFIDEGPEGIIACLSFLFGAFAVTKNGVVLGANKVFCDLVELPHDAVRGRQATDFVPENQKAYLRNIFEQNLHEPYDLALQTKSGTLKYTRVSPKVFTVKGETYRLAEFVDFTDSFQNQRVLKASEEKYKAIFHNAAIGIARISLQGQWQELNPKFCDILAYSEAELQQLSFIDITHPDDIDIDIRLLNELNSGHRKSYSLEKRYIRKDGTEVWARLSVSLVRDSNNAPLYYVVFIEDIDEQKHLHEKLERYSFIDGLTRITNRRKFDELLDSEWNRALRTDSAISFIMIDIDFFKNYNDHYGHLQGDECLIKIAQTLETIANRSSDVVARFGGEEFAILAPSANLQQATQLAERCRQAVIDLQIPHATTQVKGLEVVSVSIGVSCMTPTMKASAFTLIDVADKRLYKAKNQGRNCIVAE